MARRPRWSPQLATTNSEAFVHFGRGRSYATDCMSRHGAWGLPASLGGRPKVITSVVVLVLSDAGERVRGLPHGWLAPLLLQGAGTTGADEAGDGLCEHGSDCPGKASDDLQEFLGCTCPYRGPSLPSVSLSLEVLRNVLRGRLYFTRTKHGQSRSSTAGEREEDGLWQGLTASLLQLWHHPASPALFTSKG